MTMTPEQKEYIDILTYAECLRLWRFSPIGDPIFTGEAGEYLSKVFYELKKATKPEDQVKISKELGWGR